MTLEELNREIAEKLMGWEHRPIGKGIMKDVEYWRNPETGAVFYEKPEKKYHDSAPNYFTEGWEQAVDIMVGTGKIQITESAESIEIKTGYRITHYTVAIYIENSRGEFMMAAHNLLKTRKDARHNAIEQAWPEIVRRIDGK